MGYERDGGPGFFAPYHRPKTSGGAFIHEMVQKYKEQKGTEIIGLICPRLMYLKKIFWNLQFSGCFYFKWKIASSLSDAWCYQGKEENFVSTEYDQFRGYPTWLNPMSRRARPLMEDIMGLSFRKTDSQFSQRDSLLISNLERSAL